MRCSLLIALCLLVGCDTAFEVDLPEEEPRLVLEALFGADSLLTLQIRQSTSALASPDVADVTTAEVEITEDGVRVGTVTYVPNRLRYVTDIRPRPGRTYRIRAVTPGFDPAEAVETVPEAVPFEIVSVERGAEPTLGRDRQDVVTIRFQDPPGEDAYALYGLVQTSFPGQNAQDRFGPLGFRSADPALADGAFSGLLGETQDPFYLRAFFRSVPFDGQAVTIRLTIGRQQDETGASQLVHRLRLARVSPTYYAYVRATDSDTQPGVFGGVRRVPSNVVGGYGIFAAFTATERVIPEG